MPWRGWFALRPGVFPRGTEEVCRLWQPLLPSVECPTLVARCVFPRVFAIPGCSPRLRREVLLEPVTPQPPGCSWWRPAQRDYDKAASEALRALGTPPHQPLEGEKLARFIAADGK